ncbi:hypothetical protein TcYC6_0086850 [Trypanosoma cruzi]|nr:hypothetical protein TcYC6_0086850 [Trypanosoma cruzi]
MRASVKVWLQEQRRRRNTLPPEEEARIQRIKDRLRFGSPLCEPYDSHTESSWRKPTPVSSATAESLLQHNAVLLSRLEDVEEALRHSEKERQRLRTQLLQASDENRRCAMQLIQLALDTRRGELLLEEQLFRERLLRHESEKRQKFLWELDRRLRSDSCARASHNERLQSNPRVSLSKQFYA